MTACQAGGCDVNCGNLAGNKVTKRKFPADSSTFSYLLHILAATGLLLAVVLLVPFHFLPFQMVKIVQASDIEKLHFMNCTSSVPDSKGPQKGDISLSYNIGSSFV